MHAKTTKKIELELKTAQEKPKQIMGGGRTTAG